MSDLYMFWFFFHVSSTSSKRFDLPCFLWHSWTLWHLFCFSMRNTFSSTLSVLLMEWAVAQGSSIVARFRPLPEAGPVGWQMVEVYHVCMEWPKRFGNARLGLWVCDCGLHSLIPYLSIVQKSNSLQPHNFLVVLPERDKQANPCVHWNHSSQVKQTLGIAAN